MSPIIRTDKLFLLIIQTLGGFTSPPSDEDSEYYDVKLVFKPIHDTGSDKNTIDGVQEFIVRGVLSRDPCDSSEVRSVCVRVCVGVGVCVGVCVCVCVCVFRCMCACGCVGVYERFRMSIKWNASAVFL